ncbi:dihydrodipicolinate synthase family protein, partial [Staphylococcus lugdunensis]|nr:dihydrodipicolinate synthase family protein [Staphylococcus lugdunensis]
MILYNFPARTGSDLTPSLVANLAEKYPNIVGIKDTVDTISHTRAMIEATRRVNPDFVVFSGFDEYYTPNRIAGGNGVICGLTNVEPETFASLHKAYEASDFAHLIE